MTTDPFFEVVPDIPFEAGPLYRQWGGGRSGGIRLCHSVGEGERIVDVTATIDNTAVV